MSNRVAISIALITLLASSVTHAAVFGRDNRVPFEEVGSPETAILLTATGGIACFDGSWGSGFIVDISEHVSEEQDFLIIATSAHVLYDAETGASKGRCAYVPASAPGNYLEIGPRVSGGERLENADSNDWVFAKIERPRLEFGAIPIAFGDTYDFGPDIPLDIWSVGFIPEWGTASISTDCEVDDKSRYNALWRQPGELDHMVLHNCDLLPDARGGPLLYLSDGQFYAIGINAGDGGGPKMPSMSGIPYDPQRGFHNFARRFDKDLERKLVLFVSRFAHIKNPSDTVRQFSELIKNVQAELTRLGYDAGPVDGLLGNRTREAIQAFQTTLNIPPTGRVSDELLLLLKAR